MKQRTQTALLLSALTLLSACSLLFHETSSSSDAGGSGDGQSSVDGGTEFCNLPSNIGNNYSPGTIGIELKDREILTIDTGELTGLGASMTLANPSQGASAEDWVAALSVPAPVPKENPNILAVLSLTGLTIKDGATLRVIGDFALVVVVAGDVRIEKDGVVDVSSSSNFSGGGAMRELGAGGFRGGGGGQAGTTCSFCCNGSCREAPGQSAGGHGGYGGSHTTMGGTIGKANESGEPYGQDELIPLVGGGSGGGGSREDGLSGVRGGHGGGAIQISATGKIEIAGQIWASGGGGQGGGSGQVGGGGGAGAGGAILLESRTVQLRPTAILTVHGGSGGSGNFISPAAGSEMVRPGKDGNTGPVRFDGTGANAEPPENRSGGAGSNAEGKAGDGTLGDLATGYGGGAAGGGAGRIRINHNSFLDPEQLKMKMFPPSSISDNPNWCSR